MRSDDIADDNLTLTERFVVLLYGRIGSAASANGAHRWLSRRRTGLSITPLQL